MAKGPLQNIRILDLTHVWAGPLATRMLSDLGAQVLKVEAPMGRGPRRYPATPIGHFIGGSPGEEPWNTNAVFVKLMRNKKSLAIDLKSEAGRSTFLALVKVSDVVIENFSARAMKGLRLDYEHLKRANSKIIHVAMPGYGLSGRYSSRVAFGPTVEPMSGLVSVMGYGPEEPRVTAMAMPDPTSAVNATAAVVTALQQREISGEGSLVEMSLHESAVSYSGPWLIDAQFGNIPERTGNRHPEMVPHGIYPCKETDSWLAIGCRNQREYELLCGTANLDIDSSWSLAERRTHEDEIDEAISSWSQEQPIQKLSDTLTQAGIPSGAVLDTAGMLENPQSVEREFFVPLEQDTPMPGTPVKMSSISNDDWTPCPTLGEHNEEVLRDWLNYSNEAVDDLYAQGVIVNKPPR